MGNKEKGVVCVALRQLDEFISSLYPWSAKKAGVIISRGLAVKTENWEFFHLAALQVWKSAKRTDWLTNAIIAFGDYNIAYNLLYGVLCFEACGKKSFWKFRRPHALHAEDKIRLIDFCLANPNRMSVLIYIMHLLRLAKALPYECQKKLYFEYLARYFEFTDSGDFLDVYEMWTDLSPDLREHLHKLIRGALAMFRIRAGNHPFAFEATQDADGNTAIKPGQN